MQCRGSLELRQRACAHVGVSHAFAEYLDVCAVFTGIRWDLRSRTRASPVANLEALFTSLVARK